jgi:2-iminoacetate synthase ThiH
MFLKPTPQLLQQIKDSGVPIIKLSMEEFQKIASEGKLLTNEEVKQKLKNYGNTSNRIV